MSHRPYPSKDRALHQVDRGRAPEPVPRLTIAEWAPQIATPVMRESVQATLNAVDAAGRVLVERMRAMLPPSSVRYRLTDEGKIAP